MKSYLYEAFFCCTMRLGDGLGYLTDFALIKDEDNLIVPFPVKFEYEDENVSYDDNKITLKVNKINKPLIMKIRLPKNGINNRWLEINLNERKEYVFELENEINSQNGVFFFGDMLLTKKKEKMKNEFMINNNAYSFVYDNSTFEENVLEEKVQYVK